ncbi:MAG: ATP-binding protein [Alphaproteobacteria bacterium]|nr:ATP-binding protein [Alphaproteobacteria bacterium]
MIAAWIAKNDPAAEEAAEQASATDTSTWRLARVEACNFGGLTTFGGPVFDFWVDGTNWCILGQNGSGKTSLASAILWTLTGKRIREQDGPLDETGAREPVATGEGKQIGTWPPFASYPASAADLIQPVDVWVRLSFRNVAGDEAIAYRCLTCPVTGAPSPKVQIDPRITAYGALIEATVLMPARISRIGLGKQSQSLYEAVKILTGLDQLADIAEGAGALGNAARRFLKYGKENGLETNASRFTDDITKAKAKAEPLGFVLPESLDLSGASIVADLIAASQGASAEAGAHLATLKVEIAPTIDMSIPAGREKVRTAVNTARGLASQGANGIALFGMWAALKEAGEDVEFAAFPDALTAGEQKLERALTWHARQTEDNKFRLKALAAHYYLPPHQHTDSAHCPVCDGVLQTTTQKELAAELAELKSDASEAERKLEDVCSEILSDLTGLLPAGLRRHAEALAIMEPKKDYADAVRGRFCTVPPFSTILTGLSSSIDKRVSVQTDALPSFEFAAYVSDGGNPASADGLRSRIHGFKRLVALVAWWTGHRQVFRDRWQEIIGQKLENKTFTPGSVEAQLAVLGSALHKADPLDELAKLLKSAADAATAWAPVNAEQARRVAIAEALKPLKDLRLLVSAETSRSIAALSNRMGVILEKIHHQERLSYQRTGVEKKSVIVDGSFEPGMHIDASLVANTSWLRAILWSFLFALREQIVTKIGRNPFPLMLLDDPQTTFDPRNKRHWAKQLAALANLAQSDAMTVQLLLTTHERQFYQIVVDTEQLSGEQGMMGGVNKASAVAKIVNGGALDRLYQEAVVKNDDEIARRYMAGVRVYCEDLLKFMLRGHGSHILAMTLGDLGKELKTLTQAQTVPFNRGPFVTLMNTITGGGGKPMKYVNENHHKDDETYGVAQAKEVKEFWEKTLRSEIQDAFELFDLYESFYGEPRTFPWARNVVPFPSGYGGDIKSANLHQTGIAAAAKTDGRAGDGLFTLDEWNTAQPVKLFNHEAYQLVASTLDPVAGVGDVVLVCGHAKINPRNLVVAAVGERLLARRYNEMDGHPGIAVLTAQSVDPTVLVEPVIIANERKNCRKIVGTLFLSRQIGVTPADPKHEVTALPDAMAVKTALDGGRLFGVNGRSAEPIALDGQFIITRAPVVGLAAMKAYDGRMVVAIDDAGTPYFKRLRWGSKFVVLESLNPDGNTPSEVLSLDDSLGLPQLSQILEVAGVLFELPAPSTA